MHHRPQHVLRAHQPAVKQDQARRRHHQNEGRAHQQPGIVARVDGRGGADLGLQLGDSGLQRECRYVRAPTVRTAPKQQQHKYPNASSTAINYISHGPALDAKDGLWSVGIPDLSRVSALGLLSPIGNVRGL